MTSISSRKSKKSNTLNMKKGQNKVKICISLDKDLYEKIKEHCDENLIKLSAYINHVLKKNE